MKLEKISNQMKSSLVLVVIFAALAKGCINSVFKLFDENTSSSSWDAFISSFAMIIISELGDKTFFLAAVLAMKARNKDKLKVFLGSILALALMSLLSVLLGGFIFTWIPTIYTRVASSLLFLIFSALMVREAILSRSSSSTASASRSFEVEEKITPNTSSLFSVSEDDANEDTTSTSSSAKTHRLLFSKSFILTFVAEWGDRSQLATIALASTKNIPSVFFGAIAGHAVCTGTAVLGGAFVANHLSVRKVTLSGAILFFVFFVASVLEIALDDSNKT